MPRLRLSQSQRVCEAGGRRQEASGDGVSHALTPSRYHPPPESKA
jgi:hypothetical protein